MKKKEKAKDKICPLDTNPCGDSGYCEGCPNKKQTEKMSSVFNRWNERK